MKFSVPVQVAKNYLSITGTNKSMMKMTTELLIVEMDTLFETILDIELNEDLEIVPGCGDIELGADELGVEGNMEGREYRDPLG
jgi:hypothetical protein